MAQCSFIRCVFKSLVKYLASFHAEITPLTVTSHETTQIMNSEEPSGKLMFMRNEAHTGSVITHRSRTSCGDTQYICHHCGGCSHQCCPGNSFHGDSNNSMHIQEAYSKFVSLLAT